jgi:hypothetical protein
MTIKARLLRASPFVVLGVSLEVIGVPLTDWEWWAVVVPMSIAVSTVRSLEA